ncbi:hypothetical protein ACH4RG_23010 [Streptomyces sp. NPDC021019]|uniref:hypothetical protein n=1 Tax=Streptomyces sp. NPDC021019 TaxID=3365108 RepID=UPI0037956C98
MAPCCRTPCSCLINAGTGVTVTGDGQVGTPFVISATGGDVLPVVTAPDTNSVDQTVTGTGAPATPYVITSNVKLDATPPGGGTNLIGVGPEGLYVECAQVRGCISAGDGLDYSPATGVMTAQISAVAGNTTSIAADGGLYTPAGSTVVQPLDTPTIDATVTGTGAPATPYVVSAAVRLDATPPGGGTNLIGSNADGLYVECAGVRGCISAGDGLDYDPATGVMEAQISVAAGNIISIGPDGGLLSTGGTGLTAPDTATVDQTLTGNGSGATPYVLTSNVKVDATPPGGGTNLIGVGPDGLYVECAQVRGCISAGDGLDYDPATGVMEVQLSTDPTNTATIAPDGGVLVPAGASTVVQPLDTPTIDATITGTGAPATPYVVSAAVRLDATPPGGGTNLIGSGPDGLYVECAQVRTCISAGDGLDYDPATGVMEAQLSTDPANTLTIAPDGGLLVPAGASTVVQPLDTPTIDTTVTGTGAPATPYVVSSAVRLDATPPGGGTNLIGSGADGLYVECAGVRGCISAGDGLDYDPATGVMELQLSTDPANTATIAPDGGLLVGSGAATVVQPLDTPTIDATVTGTGAPATPYVVSAAVRLDATPPGGGTNLINAGPDGLYLECAQVRGCISAGDGLDYDPVTGVMEAQISADAGNTTIIGTDGGLYTPTAAVVVQPLDTPTIDSTVTGTGAPATPYVVSSAVRLDATPPGGGANLIGSGADGLYVELVTGCGLEGTGAVGDPLIVAPAAGQEAWPWACDVVAESGTKCDPATGQIWSPPEHYSAMDHIYVDHFVGGIADPITATGGWTIIDPTANQQFNIPPNFIGNNCRRWGYEITATGTFDITHTPDAVFQLGYVVQQDAVPLQVRPGWGLLTARGGVARRVVRNITANETLWDILPTVGSFTVMYPAINVVSGSVTIASWVTDATIDTQTNQG